MMFDARFLARGWLAVAHAASGDRNLAHLHRTVHLAMHEHGLLITAADGTILLRTYVPARGHDETSYPVSGDEPPLGRATVKDPHARGAGFLGHVLKLATSPPPGAPAGTPAPDIDVRVHLNATVDEGDAGPLPGFEAKRVVLEHPDAERLELDVAEVRYPDVCAAVDHQMHHRRDVPGLGHERIRFHPDVLARLGKATKVHPRASLGMSPTGPNAPVYVELVDSEPYVDGLAMPMRSDPAPT